MDRNVKASHWFGREWAINFWTTNFIAYAEEDFAKLREDGFNSIVLVVPWLGFIDPYSGKPDESYFGKLDAIIAVAKKHNLNIIARTGYTWNIEIDSNHRLIRDLLTDGRVYDYWLNFMREMGCRYEKDKSYLFSFISWEDYWPIIQMGSHSREERLEYSIKCGYQNFLSAHYDLTQISENYREKFTDWKHVPVPSRIHPSFRLFFEFYQQVFIEKLFKPAAKLAPRMSAEVRVDHDPIFDGSRVVGTFEWDDTWNLEGAEWVTVYYNPYFGSANNNNAISPETANRNLDSMLKSMKQKIGNKKIFIDQFNFRDDTPGMTSDYIKNSDLPSFLDLATKSISETADGYALWFYHGYEHNGLGRPDFADNLEGWSSAGELIVRRGQLTLFAGSYLEKTLQKNKMHLHDDSGSVSLSLTGLAGKVSIRVDDEYVGPLILDGTANNVNIKLKDITKIRIEAEDGVAVIQRMSIFDYEQIGTVYDKNGQPLFLHEDVRKMNLNLWPAKRSATSNYLT